MTTRNIHDYNGATLAYIGDAVIELLIREALTSSGISDTGRLSAAAQKLVCAKTQSAIADMLLPELSEKEEAAYRLGRNHHASGKPKNATVAEFYIHTKIYNFIIFPLLLCTFYFKDILTFYSILC